MYVGMSHSSCESPALLKPSYVAVWLLSSDEEAWENYVKEKKKKEKQIQKREQKKVRYMRIGLECR